VSTIAEQRVVLASVSWATYCALVDESQENRGRMTYDQGVLEIMSPMLSHETAKALLGRMVERFTEIRDIDMRSSKSTTFRRSELQRGFEADESYYIQHFANLLGKREVDLAFDPPPDLVIEIEMTRSAINKLALFASMEIPEVWRYDGSVLILSALSGDAYEEITESKVLPGFPVQLASQLLAMRSEVSETDLIRRFARQVVDEH
jgi:Uma2 family endonuclease